jgi:hypothetical protein
MVATQIPSTDAAPPASPVREVIRTAAVVAASGVVVGLVGLLSVAGIVGALWRGDVSPATAD